MTDEHRLARPAATAVGWSGWSLHEKPGRPKEGQEVASTFHLNFLNAPSIASAPRSSDAVLSSPTSLWVRPLVAGCLVRLSPKAGNVIASEAGAGEARLPRESSTFRKLSRRAWRRRPRPSLVCLLRSHRTAADAPAPLVIFNAARGTAEPHNLITMGMGPRNAV